VTASRKEDDHALASDTIDPQEIEAQYRRSPFVEEICVMRWSGSADCTTDRLFAVVVPAFDLFRRRRIVNIGDMLRFELEGQSIHLAPHKRVLGYDIWFEPLPRTTGGELKRDEIERRVRDKYQRRKSLRHLPRSGDEPWANDPHASATVAIIARHANGAAVSLDANLELDLGLDSMDRVALIAELQKRFGARIAEEDEAGIFTVGQLVEAVRPASPTSVLADTENWSRQSASDSGATADSWTQLLHSLPLPNDPLVSGLLQRRPISARLFFLLPRLIRILLPRITFRGLEHLPSRGPYIIAPNHQGYVDPFIVCSGLPFHIFRQVFFVGAAEYFETPFMRWLAKKANCVLVDPDANLMPAMKAGAFGLTRGKILLLFPEGERSIDGTVKRFKKGAPVLSRHLGVPVVPVAVRGSFELWPRNRPVNWRALLPWHGHRIRVTVGTPVDFKECATDADAATELRAIVERLWNSP
jgi:long-chain acyl-CoA synthetase